MAIAPTILHPSFFILIFNIIIKFSITSSMTEAEALLSLKNSFTNSVALNNWIAGTLPCAEDGQWEGVICYNGLVTGLRLDRMGLVGKIDVDALLELKGLRTISLEDNSFVGPIPELNRIGYLKAVYMSRNKFSGHIPKEYFQTMNSLKKVYLSDNEFTGEVPLSLADVPTLLELHLENNQFSGIIPNLNNPALVEFNVSNNNLEGEVPKSLMRFNESSFLGNAGLCGEKFGKICGQTMMKKKPVNAPDINNITQLNNHNKSNVYVSVPDQSKHRSLQIVGIVVTCVALIALAIFLIVRSRKKKEKEKSNDDSEKSGLESANDCGGSFEVQVSSNSICSSDISNNQAKRDNLAKKGSSSRRSSSHGSKGIGELVMMNEEKGVFSMSDLMKASAEVLGNGGFGSSYKAVMANGVAVVVKRTRELNALGKDGFDAEMKMLGRVHHWNVLTPLAYHYRKDEKLVISEYVPRGSLLYLLHGDKGPSHTELDWNTRLKIVQGIAKGMQYLHTKLSSDLPHGNLKSSNVLLGPDYEPLLMDYGFIHLVNPSNYSNTLFAYKSPEALQHNQISPRSDVYCLGVVILEIITGKFPSQYLSNGKGGTDLVQWVTSVISEGRELELLDPEIASKRDSLDDMKQLVYIGAACTESNPRKRLDMTEAARRIEEIKTNEVEHVQESRTIEVLPSFDGYADSLQGYDDDDEESRRKRGTNSFGSKDTVDFGVS